MTFDYLVSAVLAVLLFAYLVRSLLRAGR